MNPSTVNGKAILTFKARDEAVTHLFTTSFLTAAATQFAAEIADSGKDDRVISGLVLPFNETGRTSSGPLTVKAGAVKLPDDLGHVKLYRDHSNEDGSTPVGKAVSAEVRTTAFTRLFALATPPMVTPQ